MKKEKKSQELYLTDYNWLSVQNLWQAHYQILLIILLKEFIKLNNLYEWAMPQKLPANDFKRVEGISKFNEDYIKSYNDESDERYFLEVDVQHSENLHKLHKDLPFLPERMKIEKVLHKRNFFL